MHTILTLVAFLEENAVVTSHYTETNNKLVKTFECSDCGHKTNEPYPPFLLKRSEEHTIQVDTESAGTGKGGVDKKEHESNEKENNNNSPRTGRVLHKNIVNLIISTDMDAKHEKNIKAMKKKYHTDHVMIDYISKKLMCVTEMEKKRI